MSRNYTTHVWVIEYKLRRGGWQPIFTEHILWSSRSATIAGFLKWYAKPRDLALTWRQLKRRGYRCVKKTLVEGWQ